MPKKIIKRWMPNHQTIKENKYLQIFGDLLHNANLWHFNRRSVAKAFAVGLFVAFLPIPFQMVLAASIAIIVHANLPLSVALVWITNPLTMPFIFYFNYVVGTWILGVSEQPFAFDASWQWVVESFSTIGPALFLGSVVLGAIFAIIGFFGIKILWRYSVAKEWKKRQYRHK